MADSAKNSETIQSITRIESELKFEKERELEKIIQTNKELETQLELNRQKQSRNVALIAGFALLLIAGIVYRNYLLKSKDNVKLREQKEEITTQKEEIQTQHDRIEALNKTKDRFFAIIAHDLKNPLGGVYKLSEVIQTDYETMETEKLNTYLFHLRNSAEKAYILLENLLQWATLQLGKISVSRKVFNLIEVIRDNTDLLAGYASQKNISIQHESCNECVVYADPDLTNTVIRNLLTNALKFTPENGSVKIKVNFEANYWIVSITDTGIGISGDDQKLLFNLASQSKNIGTSKEKGTGLGLILCKEFTELNGGKIWLESELGKGSTFFVSIPKLSESIEAE
jgi:signal transduction histidine kinase